MNQYKTIEEILDANKQKQRKLVQELKREEASERLETYEQIEASIKAINNETERGKQAFIREIKNGLGDEIKKNEGIKVRKKNWFSRIIKKLFTKF